MGCGKTVVAFLGLIEVIDAGYQVISIPRLSFKGFSACFLCEGGLMLSPKQGYRRWCCVFSVHENYKEFFYHFIIFLCMEGFILNF